MMPAPDAGAAPSGYVGNLPNTGHQYRLLRARGAGKGTALTLDTLVAELSDADAVCLGEEHPDPDAHAVQLLVLDRFATQAVAAGRRVALGMEMFQLPFQGVLDDYTAGVIDEPTMLARSQWQQRWGLDYALYRPLVDRLRQAMGSLRALNARDEIVKRVAQVGIGGLTDAERAQIPELDLTNAQHKAWFVATVFGVGHPAAGSSVDNLYAAQVVRDETMAEAAWFWLTAQDPNPRQIAIAAGNGHCIDLAVPARLRRRGAHKVVIVRPVPEDAAQIAAGLAEELTDVLIVYAP
jgi:uncharacterized iron-regulated protein